MFFSQKDLEISTFRCIFVENSKQRKPMKRNTFLKATLLVINLWMLVGLTACSDSDSPEEPAKEKTVLDPAMKGIWKVVSFRLSGANLMSWNPLSYIVIDPSTNDFVLIAKPDIDTTFVKENILPIQGLKMAPTDSLIALYEPEDYEKYAGSSQLKEHAKNDFKYLLSQDESELFVYLDARQFLSEEILKREPDAQRVNLMLQRDTELEASVSEGGNSTRSWWSDLKSWAAKAAVAVATSIVEPILKTYSNLIEPHLSGIENEDLTARHSQGWKPENWMSLLPDEMRVCEVNIPGSHDSSTASCNMNAVAVGVSADCQTYSIPDQFNKGARYFDLRVGNTFTYEWGKGLRIPTASEAAATEDLTMYHGCFSTNTKYKETLRNLAKMITKDRTEFLFINTQWEDLSFGLLSKVALEVANEELKAAVKTYNTLTGDSIPTNLALDDQTINELKLVTLDIANRLQRELNNEFNDSLFIPYSSDLTVKQARGHIILMMTPFDNGKAEQNRQVSYVFGWPDNKLGYAHTCDWILNDKDLRKSDPANVYMSQWDNSYNMRVQSFYEMKLSEYGNIAQKKADAKTLATEVTAWNNDGVHHILGFNAMNANGGASGFYDLDSYEFAHKFNGFAYDMYVDNMKLAKGSERFRAGLVTMDHFGAKEYDSPLRAIDVDVYGDLLSWAVIESNFYNQ